MQSGCRSSLAVQAESAVHACALRTVDASAPVLLGMCVAFHLQLAPRVQELGLPVQYLHGSVGSKTGPALGLAVAVWLEVASMLVSPLSVLIVSFGSLQHLVILAFLSCFSCSACVLSNSHMLSLSMTIA